MMSAPTRLARHVAINEQVAACLVSTGHHVQEPYRQTLNSIAPYIVNMLAKYRRF